MANASPTMLPLVFCVSHPLLEHLMMLLAQTGWGHQDQLGYVPFCFFQHLIYPSKHLNHSAVWALLDSLSRELQALTEHPNGTETNPAATCKELLLAHPSLPDGTGVHMGSPHAGLRGAHPCPWASVGAQAMKRR